MKANTLTRLALLLALALALAVVEAMLPVPLPPGVKFGLSNIVVMYALFAGGRRYEAAVIAVLKSAFVLVTRGLYAALFSFCGGMCALAVMLVLGVLFRRRLSLLFVSVCGSVTHNAAQCALLALLFDPAAALYYLPLLILSGVGMGVLTAIIGKGVIRNRKEPSSSCQSS